jgi:L-lactate dehydrogenase complex protein LldG
MDADARNSDIRPYQFQELVEKSQCRWRLNPKFELRIPKETGVLIMTSRENILARVKEALQARAPMPGAHDGERVDGVHVPPEPGGFKQWLPPVGATFEERRNLFARNAEMLKATFKVVSTPEAAAAELRQIASSEQWTKIATHHSPLTDAVCTGLGTPLLYTDAGYDIPVLEVCEGGVTVCEALIAQTGSVLITSRSCGGRALSILPPHHVVVATRDQLLPDLASAFELLRKQYDGDYPSTISFITGPSRTGDIERILVLGAHGPKRLTILLCNTPGV